MRMPDLIAKKRAGGAHTPEELRFIAAGAASGSIPDYQLAAWLMAVCWRGMSREETVVLTREMADSGAKLDLAAVKARKADKHSTGGVGDGISLALAPLIAEAGLAVPMMSGRGLGHTGGTLDKLESIGGFKVRLPLREIEAQIKELGVCLFGQSEDLAPADRKLYALRDATSTVESLPLIVGSILSKKTAEDLDALVLDVKVGSGAIFQRRSKARELARELVRTAKGLGIETAAVLTAMDQPLGRYVGNALEIRQAVEVLRGHHTGTDYVDVLLTLGGWMLHLAGKARTPRDGEKKLEEIRLSGAGFERFKKIVAAQGGDPELLDSLPEAPLRAEVRAWKSGYIGRLDARVTGQAAVRLGAGRATAEDKLDYGAGLILEKKVGAKVAKGEVLAVLLASDARRLEDGRAHFLTGLEIAARAPRKTPFIYEVIR
jgi:pyrimidine-nucleoside phosphorylase